MPSNCQSLANLSSFAQIIRHANQSLSSNDPVQALNPLCEQLRKAVEIRQIDNYQDITMSRHGADMFYAATYSPEFCQNFFHFSRCDVYFHECPHC